VEVDKNRLLPLMLNKVKPKDRPEEEVLGYKQALSFIFDSYGSIAINPKVILKLHELAQDGNLHDARQFIASLTGRRLYLGTSFLPVFCP
jgi:hypothetical protein